MGLAANLKAAEWAVHQVLWRLKNGSTTRGDQREPQCVKAMRALSNQCSGAAAGLPSRAVAENTIHCSAVWAAKWQCGNCGEHAALAYTLLKRRGSRPLDVMKALNADHMFVVIGRRRGSYSTRISTWGPHAVVCDPWDYVRVGTRKKPGRFYRARLLSVLMLNGLGVKPTSVLRLPDDGSA